MLRFLIFLFLTIALNIWVLRELVTSVTPPHENAKEVASVSKKHGRVLVRPSGYSEWRELKYDHKLSAGDFVFVGKNAKLVYTYKKHKARVTMQQNSIAEVSHSPSIASKMFRNFYKTKSIGENKSGNAAATSLRRNRIYVRMEQAPTTVEMSAEGPTAQESTEYQTFTSIEREAKALRILQPTGDVNIISEQNQERIAVQIEKPATQTKLFGYLWKKYGGPRPVWVGVLNRSYTFNVEIPESGEFVFQAMSEDDEYISPVIFVNLKQHKGYKAHAELAKAFDSNTWSGKQVLVLR